jgi:predicted aspartyl protease
LSFGYDPATSATRVAITTASTIEKAPLITLRRVRVLGVEAKQVEVVVHDLPPKSRVDGLLGLSFLRHFNIHLLFRDGVLEIR